MTPVDASPSRGRSRYDFVGSTLVGATSPAQLEESLAATDKTLPPDVLAKVDAISREIRYPMG